VAAEKLRERIFDEQLPAGHRLGSQDELIDEMGLSRGSAREALLLLQYDGLVEARPGPAGGVYVAAPRVDTVVAAARNYIRFHGIQPEAISAARAVIEPPLAAAAATVRGGRHVAELRECLAR